MSSRWLFEHKLSSRIYHTTKGREVEVKPGCVVTLEPGEELDLENYSYWSDLFGKWIAVSWVGVETPRV